MKKLLDEIFDIPSTPILFNYYRDIVPDLDLENGAEIRRNNLLNMISCYKQFPSYLLLGEAAGWKGCRFSGIPFTGENLLIRLDFAAQGHKSSLADKPYTENSGTIFWRNLKLYYPNFFVWNTVPFHPHLPENYLSNRTPTREEIEFLNLFCFD